MIGLVAFSRVIPKGIELSLNRDISWKTRHPDALRRAVHGKRAALFHIRFRDIAHCDAAAFRGELFGKRASDPGTAPRYNRKFSAKVFHRFHPVYLLISVSV